MSAERRASSSDGRRRQCASMRRQASETCFTEDVTLPATTSRQSRPASFHLEAACPQHPTPSCKARSLVISARSQNHCVDMPGKHAADQSSLKDSLQGLEAGESLRCAIDKDSEAPGGKAGLATAAQVIVQGRPEEAWRHTGCQQCMACHLPALKRPSAQVHLQADSRRA